MRARKRTTVQTDFDDTVENSVAEFFDSHWEQWRDQFGIYGVSVERDDKGELVLVVEADPQPGTVSSSLTTFPPFIDLSIPGLAAPVHLNIRRVERRPPHKQERVAGGTPGAGNIAAGRASQGTLGGWAWDTTDDTLVLLSCQHVLGPANEPVFLGPSPSSHVRIGTVKRSIRHSPAVPVDCAIAAIDVAHDPAFVVESLGPAIMMTESQLRRNLPARKRAATTHLREGKVVAGSRRVTVDGEHYPRVIEVKGEGAPWSASGDSGALVFNDEARDSGLRAVIGLHFAGHEELDRNGFALRIGDVFAALRLTTLPDGLLTALLVEATDTRAAAHAAREAFVDLYFSIDDTPLTKALLAVIEDPEYLLRLTLDSGARRHVSALLRRLLEGGATVDRILEHRIAPKDAELLGDAPAGLDAATFGALTALVGAVTHAAGKTLGETLLEQAL